MEQDLARLIVRHRDVAPMLSALLTGTNAGVRIRDAAGAVVLEREAGGIASERFPIVVEGETIGSVEGDRVARSIASVLSYACSREADKRSLAREALDRYRELNLVYELADRLSDATSVEGVAAIAIEEAGRLAAGGAGFVLVTGPDGEARSVGASAVDWAVRPGEGILGAVLASALAEEVNEVRADGRATAAESSLASVVAAPLVARGRTLGLLGAASTTPIVYQAADLKLVAAIAAIAGPALAQVRTPADDRASAPAG
ncbi:MAG TPA: GAF domain-containing protein [Candidatus Limnocylindrales bacterium]